MLVFRGKNLETDYIFLRRGIVVCGSEDKASACNEPAFMTLGHEDPLEKGMATHSSTRACKIPWTEKPGRLQSVGLQRVGHDCATSLSLSRRGMVVYNISSIK